MAPRANYSSIPVFPMAYSGVPLFIPAYQWPSLEKGNSSQRHKFTKAEDDLLKRLVDKYGESNWMQVAAQMKTRSPRQCRERFRNYLSDHIVNGPWTLQEEQLLEEKVREHGQKWSVVSQYFETRSDVNVKNHWTALVNRQQREKQCAVIKAKEIEIIQKKKGIESNDKEVEKLPAQNEDNLTGSVWNEENDAEWEASSIAPYLNDSFMDFFS